MTDIDGEPLLDTVYAEETAQPTEIVVGFRDGLSGYRAATGYSRRLGTGVLRQETVDLPCVSDPSVAPGLADRILARAWTRSRLIRFGLPLRHAGLVPGQIIAFASAADERWIVTRTSFGDRLAVEAAPIAVRPANSRPATLSILSAGAFAGDLAGRPDFALVDLPMQPGGTPESQFRIAAWTSPPRTQAVHVSPGTDGFERRAVINANAVIGTLDAPLAGAFSGRLDQANAVLVSVPFRRVF